MSWRQAINCAYPFLMKANGPCALSHICASRAGAVHEKVTKRTASAAIDEISWRVAMA